MRLFNIIAKNFRILFRSKSSALTVLFGPLLIIFIIGIAFNNQSTMSVNVGYHSNMYNDLTNSFIDVLKEKKEYNLVKQNSIEECKEKIAKGEIHICIDFPEYFELADGKVNNVKFYVDNSKIHFFEAVIDSIESDFNKRAIQVTKGLTKDLVDTLDSTELTLAKTANSLQNVQELSVSQTDSTDSVSKELGSMNLSFDSDDFKTKDLKSKVALFNLQFTDLNKAGVDARDEWEDLLEDFEDKVNSSATILPEDKVALLEIINSSRKSGAGIELRQNSSYQSGKAMFEQTNKLINDLNDELLNVESRMQTSEMKQANAEKDIAELRTYPSESRRSMDEIQKAFSDIALSIEGIDVTDVNSIVQPISKEIIPVVNEKSQLGFYFPYLIILVVMFIGILLGSTLTVSEKKTKARFRNFITPTKEYIFALSIYITTMIVIIFELLIIFLILYLYFHYNIMFNLYSTLIIIFLSATLFTILGMIIGIIFSSEESATLTSITFGSVFLFISDLVFPLERMPQYISMLAKNYNPFVICSDMLRKSFVHNVSLDSLTQIQTLGIFIFILFIVLVISSLFIREDMLNHIICLLKRKRIKRKMVMDSHRVLVDTYVNMKQQDGFETLSGERLVKLYDIIKYFDELSDNNFEEIVNKDENKISYWVRNNLKNNSLADKLHKQTSKKKIISILKKANSEYYDMITKVTLFDQNKKKEDSKKAEKEKIIAEKLSKEEEKKKKKEEKKEEKKKQEKN